MGILNRLWSKVWADEETKKSVIYHTKVQQAVSLAADELKRPTDIQEIALKYHGTPEPPEPLYGQNMTTSNQHNMLYNQGSQQQALHMQQALANQSVASGNYGVGLGQGQAGGLSNSPYLGIGGGGSGGGGVLTIPLGGSLTVSGTALASHVLTTNGISSVPSWVHNMPNAVQLSEPNRTVFFTVLRGVEEASLKKPDGTFAYDDDALSIQDMRTFKPDEISLLALASFCCSNLMEVEPVVTFLEGYGMKVVA